MLYLQYQQLEQENAALRAELEAAHGELARKAANEQRLATGIRDAERDQATLMARVQELEAQLQAAQQAAGTSDQPQDPPSPTTSAENRSTAELRSSVGRRQREARTSLTNSVRGIGMCTTNLMFIKTTSNTSSQ